MKKIFLLATALFIAFALQAQVPLNDDCAGLIDLGNAPACPLDTFNNVNATPSNIGNDNNPSCFNSGSAERDVWFMFTCPDTLFDFRITVTGVGIDPLQNPEFAIYRGDCSFDGLAELLCAKADVGENEVFIDVTGLTPGLQYFIRISDYSTSASPNSGSFVLCVDEIPPIINIDGGGSTLCSGTVYDTGGPDGDYGADENFTFVICPNQQTACITFTLDYFNIDNAFGGDFLAIYDGDDTNAPIIASINGGGFGGTDIGGGGGVCFQVQASSGCLTLQFQSDAFTEQEGFMGHWECSSEPCENPFVMTVDTDVDSDDIVDAISTPFTTVTVTDINCPEGAYGTFSFPTTDNNNDLGLNKGLILTSGSANLTVGPNFLPSSGQNNFGAGDPDLNYLSQQQGNSSLSFDACIVELDVFVATDELTFEYVFGSDEYPEFVNTNFNDIFAFLVSGPGIVGDPNLGNAVNIATIPNTPLPVQINSVNNLLNWQYYRNNEVGQVLEYDGLTSDSIGIKKSLTARTGVIPCNTYHLKLAVGDRSDGVYDSGVFLSEIRGSTPNLAVQFASGIDYFIEDCSGTEDELVVSLNQPLDDTLSFVVTVGGTATLGVDYNLTIPSVITFLPGITSLSFPIFPIADNMVEGTEFISIALSNNFGCGDVVYTTINIEIKDNVEVFVNTGADTIFVCAGATLQLEATGAVNYFWAPPGAVSNPFIGNPTITPVQDLWLEVTGTIATCVDFDSVFIKIIDPTIDVATSDPVNICQGTSVQLQANNNVLNQGLVWTPAAGLNNPNSQNPVATPSVTTTYTASVTIAGCTVSDTITINVDTLFFPLVIEDTIVCQNYPVQLGNVISGTTDYQWTPQDGLSDPTSSGPVALPDVTTTYTLVATSANNYCTQTVSTTVSVIAADVDIQGAEYIEICLGETVPLTAASTPAGAIVNWSPTFYVSDPTGPNTESNPDESVTIYATYVVNNCLVRDSVYIRVDSLPNTDITRQPDKSVYCPGDTIYLISKTYEPASFPDIDIEWLPEGMQLTPDSLWNMVILATETLTMTRITTNHACEDTSTVEIPVGTIPTITITATPATVCPGEPVQLNATVDINTPLEWMPAQPPLSCTECPNPVANPQFTTVYTVEAAEADCPASASITIPVLPLPLINLVVDPVICLGESVQLNSASDQMSTYNWTSTPPGFVSSDPTPTVSPTSTTTYNLVASNSACTIERTVLVTVAIDNIDAGADQTICLGETATLTANKALPGGSVVWNPSGKTDFTIMEQPGIGNTTYTVTYTYGNNCIDSDSLVVTVFPPVDLSAITATPDPTDSLCEGTPIALKVTVNPADALLVWTENGQTLSLTGDSITVTAMVVDGQATYAVTATDENGCSASADPVTFNFIRCFVIPNAFTPNDGDDVNDTFGPYVRGGEINLLEFFVYNRWGNKVFEATPAKQRWDGTQDGKEAPSDTYIYKMRVRYADGTEESFHGDVTLFR
ncbi:MAG: choice-of-anchor L domain-containing protein [Saprospiraceae bacterium]|nr:choice-of-anchor L domain-containing protein [Saprospiraceae bacterium]MCC6412694.1 choice-of-anchor L domain-containing protein [Saprospiraceae bacterium]